MHLFTLSHIYELNMNLWSNFRVLQVAKQETENSEDTGYIRRVDEASDNMTSTIQPMVESAKSLAKNITHPGLVADWRKNNNLVSHLNFLWYDELQSVVKESWNYDTSY